MKTSFLVIIGSQANEAYSRKVVFAAAVVLLIILKMMKDYYCDFTDCLLVNLHITGECKLKFFQQVCNPSQCDDDDGMPYKEQNYSPRNVNNLSHKFNDDPDLERREMCSLLLLKVICVPKSS